MRGPKAPEPPDPRETASAQTGQNVGTAIANQVLGNVNQVTPYGNRIFNQTGTYKFTDPLSGSTYDLPQYTMKQTLNPAQQRLQNTQTQAETNLAGLARDQSARLGGILGKPVNVNGAPQVQAPELRGGIAPRNMTEVGRTPQLRGSFGDAGDITRTYGTDFSKDRRRVEQALLGRLNPSLERDRARLESNLSNRGIKLGSGAYDRGVDEFTRQSNDARLGAILGAGEEQSRMVGMEAQRAGFENQAQQQAYNQALGRGTFSNNARQQMFQNNVGRVTANNAARQAEFQNRLSSRAFGNQAAQQGFGNQRQLRGDYLQEQYASRNQPINEIAALLGTGQVQNPMFGQGGGAQMPNVDYAGMVGQNYNQRLAAWQAQQQNNPMNGIMGGLFGLGSAGIMAL